MKKTNLKKKLETQQISDKVYTRKQVEEMLKTVGMLSFQSGVEVCKKGGVSRGDFTVTEWIEKNLK